MQGTRRLRELNWCWLVFGGGGQSPGSDWQAFQTASQSQVQRLVPGTA